MPLRGFRGASRNALPKLSLGRHVPPPRYNRVQRDRDRREYHYDRRRINAEHSRPVSRLPTAICFPPDAPTGSEGCSGGRECEGSRQVRPQGNCPEESRSAKEREGGRETGAKNYRGGRFFFLCPKTGRILQTDPMYRRENNDFVRDELRKVPGRYPHVNFFIYDRACKIKKSVLQRKRKLWKISTYTTDKFHGARRKKNALPTHSPIRA